MTRVPALHFLPETRSPETGKLDARRTAQALGLTMRELSSVLGRDASGLAKHPTSDRLQTQLQTLDTLALQLRDVFGGLDVGRMWLRAPNPVLGGEAPIMSLLQGNASTVRKVLLLAESGMPT